MIMRKGMATIVLLSFFLQPWFLLNSDAGDSVDYKTLQNINNKASKSAGQLKMKTQKVA